MEFRDVVYSRHSTRSFTDRVVTKSEIHSMIDAAIHAPNACNMQSWHYYIITDPAIKKKIADEGICAKWVSEAPVIFVICTDAEELKQRFGEKGEVFALQDTAAAAENLLLCATDMGLGGCIIGAFDSEKCRTLLSVPKKMDIAMLVPVGEPDEPAVPKQRKPIEVVVTYI